MDPAGASSGRKRRPWRVAGSAEPQLRSWWSGGVKEVKEKGRRRRRRRTISSGRSIVVVGIGEVEKENGWRWQYLTYGRVYGSDPFLPTPPPFVGAHLHRNCFSFLTGFVNVEGIN